MRSFLRFMLSLILLGIILYAVNDRYNLAAWLMVSGSTNQAENEQTFVSEIRVAMLNGLPGTQVKYVGKVEDMKWFTEDAIDMVYNMDDPETSSDYDYLRYKTNSIYAHIVGFGNALTVTYEFEYNETADETRQVDETIKRLLAKWKIEELSDYDKIKKIHDYIIENASYDTNTEQYSAYDNLIGKSSTCQGYMSVAYKMFTQAGISSRIITGTGNKDSHGWNIVKLDGKWYNIDCTWDDPLTIDGKHISTYDYFLKSDEDFKGHTRDTEFSTAEFYETYTMAEVSYQVTAQR
ncbi:transglutaminase domain-containing protein [Anaerocolumna sp. AGMB13025]|uniref:transglutaminase domain-containing protein n=1 Tax=Anaerocolumna sp. AGMB13025 TaxID=3039116 RepID=UPI00241C4242|nr:transglutaminase domain-containing protein [Anaerocolumna sp. AGMB13025]WFR57203.1 transglutaminase domain-containing protein [Anaerocolumna sp. AGMB13025]